MQNLPTHSSASASKGMWFVFRDRDDTIRTWGSCWTGLERVYFNDQLVAESFKRDDCYVFQHKGHEYQIEFCTRSVAIGRIACSLYKDKQKIGAYNSKRRKVLNVRPTYAYLFAGLGLGLIGGLLNMPPWFIIVLIATSLAITLLTCAKKDQFIIEQVV